MPYEIETEPVIIKVPATVSLPPGNPSSAEWLALKDRVSTVEGYAIGDLANVDDAGITAGQALIYDDADGTYRPGQANVPITSLNNGTLINPDTRSFYFWGGLEAAVGSGSSSQQTQVRVIFAGSGSAQTAARSDHVHALHSTARLPIAPQGYMASGTRPLGSINVTLPAGKSCKVEAYLRIQMRGGDPGPCYYRLALTIDGSISQSPAGDQGFWCVQGVPQPNAGWEHERTITGTGAAVTVSASVAWGTGGGGFHTDYGQLVVKTWYDR